MASPALPPDPRNAPNAEKRAVLWIAALSAFFTPFMGSSVNVALPSLGEEFSLDAVSGSWVATAYLLAAAIFLIPFGKLADLHGRKKVFTLGISVYTLGSLLCALAGSGWVLILFRIVQGIGGAMIFGTSTAILTSVFPPGERGRALGISVSSTYLGLALGPVLGGILTQHFGWRSIFWINVPLGIWVLGMTVWKIKEEWSEARGEKFDVPGSILYSLVLFTLIYGFSRFPASSGWAWLFGSGLFLLAFALWERRCPSPILPLDLFLKNRVFAFSNLAALIHYSATFAVGFLLSFYLQSLQRLTPQEAGLVLMSQPIMMALLSPLAGRLSDRLESRVVASLGMGITVAGLFWLAWIQADTSLAGVIAPLMLLGIGFGFFSSPNTNAVMSSVEKRVYGVAAATLGTMRITGQMLSMGAGMLLLSVYVGQAKITPDHFPGFLQCTRAAFGLFAGLGVLGIFASLARGGGK